MVDPFHLPKRLSKAQLEYWIIFGIAVAGKSAKQTETKVNQFLALDPALTPFAKIQSMIQGKTLGRNLRKVKLGKYKLLNRAYRSAIRLDLDNLTLEALEQIPGIGMKTARMTLLYYEPEVDLVPLDTHILKFLRAQGHDAPKSTPGSRKKYLQLEQAFIAEAQKVGKTVRELDTQVWQSFAI